MDSRRWRRANVLAVDDQHANLVSLDAVLSSDFHVVRARSGEEAISILLERDDIDLILMDVQMPGMDGFETAVRVKQLPGCKDIPIVFVTAVYHEDPFVKQGYQVGAVDYFTKPLDPEILKVKVGLYASFRQKADLLREWERQIEASQELLNAGRRFSSMLEHLRMAVIVMDADQRIIYRNSEPVDEALDWWDAEGVLRRGRSTSIAHAITSGQINSETVRVGDADGESRMLLCSASPLQGADGSFAGVVLIVRDVTERDRLQDDLEERIAGLVSAGVQMAGSPQIPI